ncbi:putative effector protein, partial [Golovinomyces cichoracearum]
TVDPGLVTNEFHVVPWSVERRVRVNIAENQIDGTVDIKIPRSTKFTSMDPELLLKTAIYNVDTIFGFGRKISAITVIDENTAANLRIDAIMIVLVNLCFGYYDIECRQATEAEARAIATIIPTGNVLVSASSSDKLNRAATFIFARIHTNYQTNHAVGGTPAQGSVASSIRAFYGISSTSARDTNRRTIIEAITTVIYWATHPVHERLLLPLVIKATGITSAMMFSKASQGMVPSCILLHGIGA